MRKYLNQIQVRWFKIPRLLRILIILILIYGLVTSKCRFQECGPSYVMDAQTILIKVQSLKQVTTTRMNIQSLVDAKVDMPVLLGVLYGQSETLKANGYVIAGIDLSQTRTMSGFGNVIYLLLPAAGIQACYLDEHATQVMESAHAIFAPDQKDMSQKMRQLAIKEMMSSAYALDIIGKAQTDAKLMLDDLFAQVGITNVVTSFTSYTGDLPDSCK